MKTVLIVKCHFSWMAAVQPCDGFWYHSPFAPASPSCYLPVSRELTWVFEVLGNRYCFWCTEICQECMARNKKAWLFSSCRVLMSVYQLRSCKWGGWAESLFCWRTEIQLRKGLWLQKRDSHPVPGLVGSSELLGCLTAWLHPQEELGQPGITQFVAPLSQAWGFPNYQPSPLFSWGLQTGFLEVSDLCLYFISCLFSTNWSCAFNSRCFGTGTILSSVFPCLLFLSPFLLVLCYS